MKCDDDAVLDTAYRLDVDEDSWLSALARSVWRSCSELPGLIACEVAWRGIATAPELARTSVVGEVEELADCVESGRTGMSLEDYLSVLGPESGATTAGRLLDAHGMSVRDLPPLEWAHEQLGFDDLLTIYAVPSGAPVVILAGPVYTAQQEERIDLDAATRLASHIEAAARARAFVAGYPDAPPFTLGTDGGLERPDDRAVPEDLRDALTRAVIATERARTPRQEFRIRDADALWNDILDEGWSLVHHTDADGKRLILGVRPGETHPTAPRLSAREREILSMASRGAANKEIAGELGLSLSTVATHLRKGLAKTQVGSRRELIALRRQITGLVGEWYGGADGQS